MKRLIASLCFCALIYTSYAQINENSSYEDLYSLTRELVGRNNIDSAIIAMELAYKNFPEEEQQVTSALGYLYTRAGENSKAMVVWKSGMEKGYIYQLTNPAYKTYFTDNADFLELVDKESAIMDSSHLKYVAVLPTNYDSNKYYPVLFVFHGNSRNIEKSQESWMTELMKDEFISIFVQSYIHYNRTSFNWRVDDDKIRKEFSDVYNKTMTEYPVDTTKIIFAGMSAGGKLVLDFAFKNFVPISALVVNCPVVPDDISDELIKQFVAEKKRIAIITGENDFALEGQESLISRVNEEGGESKLIVSKDLGHEFAPEFASLLDEYLKWIIK